MIVVACFRFFFACAHQNDKKMVIRMLKKCFDGGRYAMNVKIVAECL